MASDALSPVGHVFQRLVVVLSLAWKGIPMKRFLSHLMAVAAVILGTYHLASAQQPTMPQHHDQLKIAAQKICPVSGERLGSMGKPVRVKIGKEELFLCCKGCMNRQVNAAHWATIHANFAKSQGKCPVMEKPLPVDAEWTIVEGQIVYVCCPPCIEKIEADPTKYLKKLDSFYAASLEAAATSD
jgi:hypothetical protein